MYLSTVFLRTVFLLLFISSYQSFYAQDAHRLFQEAIALKNEGKELRAQRKLEDALRIATEKQEVPLQMRCHLELAELKSNVINYKTALEHYRAFSILYRSQMSERNRKLADAVETLKSEVDSGQVQIDEKKKEIHRKEQAIDSLTTEQLRSALTVKDLELKNQKSAMELAEAGNRRNVLLLVVGMIVIALLFVIIEYFRKRRSNAVLKSKNEEIVQEKEKSENLLLNILPDTVAEELKHSGKTSSARYENATVMFTDFKGFTTFAGNNTPEDVVSMLDYYFRAFDHIISKYPIEKIKTIGDAYLCVSGVPEENEDHALHIIQAAVEFQEFMKENAAKRFGSGAELLQMRIGVHTGPVVAGVVGSKKFAYDIWGDTVNVAARMEQAGESGKINVSETVVEASKGHFNFVYRGELEAKNKGMLKMYFVEGM